jgi:hypothetical protein
MLLFFLETVKGISTSPYFCDRVLFSPELVRTLSDGGRRNPVDRGVHGALRLYRSWQRTRSGRRSCKFRHLLEPPSSQEFFEAGTFSLASHSQGLKLSEGTSVSATILRAPSQAKTEEKKRNPEMHFTKKGAQDYS